MYKLMYILIPVNSFHQMSVFLRKKARSLPSKPDKKKIKDSHKVHKTKSRQHTSVFHKCTHIYMHPQLVFITNISYVIQRVKHTLHCGP